VSVALVIQLANTPLLNGHLWPAWIYHIFPTYLINVMILKKKKVTEHNMYDLTFSTTFA